MKDKYEFLAIYLAAHYLKKELRWSYQKKSGWIRKQKRLHATRKYFFPNKV